MPQGSTKKQTFMPCAGTTVKQHYMRCATGEVPKTHKVSGALEAVVGLDRVCNPFSLNFNDKSRAYIG